MAQSKNLLPGRNPLREILKLHPERIITVYISGNKSPEILAQLDANNIQLKEVSRDELDRMSGGSRHQGFVAELKERALLSAKDFLSKDLDKSIVLLLDSIQDPHNFGAILRAAECFAVDAVIWSANRGADVTQVVAKTSVGASEIVPLVRVKNLARCVDDFKNAGYWAVGSMLSEQSQSVGEFEFPEKTLLMLGSEGNGLSPIIQKLADFQVKIPMFGQIDSLNVSQAAAVLLASYRNSGA